MNGERGFVTVFALCFIVVVALVVKGIQETDANRNTEADLLLAEFDLQNAADGGIYEAAEIVRNGKKDLLPASNNADTTERKKNQIWLVTNRTFATAHHGTIRVNVWGERLRIQENQRSYNPYKKVPVKDSYGKVIVKYGYVLISVAQLDSPRFGKMYRRAFAYVLDGYGKNSLDKPVIPGEKAEVTPEYETVVVADEDKDVVHFMALPSRKDE